MSSVIADCSIAGVSGDMFIGALVDLSGKWAALEKLASILPKIMRKCESIKVNVEKVKRKELVATRVSLSLKEEKGFTGKELLEYVEKAANELSLSRRASRISIKAAALLANSEAKVHGESVEEVHLHELGSSDTVFDLVGAALMCEELDLLDAKWFTSPVAVGGGYITSPHGVLPVPAPAVIEILKEAGIPMMSGPTSRELATPTGVAILAALKAKPLTLMPPVLPLKVGYGAGGQELVEAPNVFRIIVGGEAKIYEDEVVVVETNLDDVSGEILAHVSAALMKAGARDVSIIPVIAKKGRPGCILQVICNPENYVDMAETLFRETGTLGVRFHQSKRLILEREIIDFDFEVEGKKHTVKVKIARDKQGRIIRAKPEFEDLKRISEETGKTVRELLSELERRLPFRQE
ncbi:MAG: nickel pincer cofactor biosynthesis protein LarC [Candidatus Jordarchaeales archaeon]